MSTLDAIVNVQISRQTTGLTRVGFGIGMILGEHAVFAERARSYTDPDGLIDDGFTTSDEEHKFAVKYFSQEKKPSSLIVGRATAKVAQVTTVTVDTVVDSTDYTITINGVDFTINSGIGASFASIVAALETAINLGSEPVTAVDASPDVVLTADVAGNSFTVALNANMSQAATTPNNGIAEDIAAVEAFNDTWYALALVSRSDDDILNAATDIEARRKIFFAVSDDAGILAATTTDIFATLEAANLFRTACLYSGDQANYPEAAWMGLLLPEDPGSITWAYKTLAGITADEFTSTEIANMQSKNVTFYHEVSGVDVTRDAKVAGGDFIDVIRGIDWLQVRLQERIFADLINNPKIPFTDAGIGVIESEVRAQLQEGIRVNFIAADPAPTVSVPLASEVDSADKAARLLPDVTFEATLAGAIHAVEISGTVTV